MFSAPEAKDIYSGVTAHLSPDCQSRLKGINEFPILLTVPEIREQLASGAVPKNLAKALTSWSSDLIVKIVLQWELDFASVCPEPERLTKLRAELKNTYLKKLKLKVDGLSAADQAKLFRGLLAVKGDADLLAKSLQAFKKRVTVDGILKFVYGHADTVGGVLVVGAKPEQLSELKTLVAEVCTEVPCPLWDPMVLYRVSVTEKPGVAAYVPELAELVLSDSLLAQPTRLHRVVILHELAHAAERRAWHLQRENWGETFAAFSGWKKDARGGLSLALKKEEKGSQRKDILCELSFNSPFSVLPDPVLWPEEKGRDGFVLAKAYRATLEREDVTEDLSDHVAAFRYSPERFCVGPVALAPLKYEWVRSHLFPKAPALTCPFKN